VARGGQRCDIEERRATSTSGRQHRRAACDVGEHHSRRKRHDDHDRLMRERWRQPTSIGMIGGGGDNCPEVQAAAAAETAHNDDSWRAQRKVVGVEMHSGDSSSSQRSPSSA
jgi:hypothetical protein